MESMENNAEILVDILVDFFIENLKVLYKVITTRSYPRQQEKNQVIIFN